MHKHRSIASCTSTRRPSLQALWITDDILADAFRRFSSGYVRHGSNVPGPLEFRRRATRRKNTSLAHIPAQPAIDPSLLFASKLETGWWAADKIANAPTTVEALANEKTLDWLYKDADELADENLWQAAEPADQEAAPDLQNGATKTSTPETPEHAHLEPDLGYVEEIGTSHTVSQSPSCAQNHDENGHFTAELAGCTTTENLQNLCARHAEISQLTKAQLQQIFKHAQHNLKWREYIKYLEAPEFHYSDSGHFDLFVESDSKNSPQAGSFTSAQNHKLQRTKLYWATHAAIQSGLVSDLEWMHMVDVLIAKLHALHPDRVLYRATGDLRGLLWSFQQRKDSLSQEWLRLCLDRLSELPTRETRPFGPNDRSIIVSRWRLHQLLPVADVTELASLFVNYLQQWSSAESTDKSMKLLTELSRHTFFQVIGRVGAVLLSPSEIDLSEGQKWLAVLDSVCKSYHLSDSMTLVDAQSMKLGLPDDIPEITQSFIFLWLHYIMFQHELSSTAGTEPIRISSWSLSDVFPTQAAELADTESSIYEHLCSTSSHLPAVDHGSLRATLPRLLTFLNVPIKQRDREWQPMIAQDNNDALGRHTGHEWSADKPAAADALVKHAKPQRLATIVRNKNKDVNATLEPPVQEWMFTAVSDHENTHPELTKYGRLLTAVQIGINELIHNQSYVEARQDASNQLRSIAHVITTDLVTFQQLISTLVVSDKLSIRLIKRVLENSRHFSLAVAWSRARQLHRPRRRKRRPVIDSQQALETMHVFAMACALSPAVSSRQALENVKWCLDFLLSCGALIQSPITRALWHAGVTRNAGVPLPQARLEWIVRWIIDVEGKDVARALLDSEGFRKQRNGIMKSIALNFPRLHQSQTKEDYPEEDPDPYQLSEQPPELLLPPEVVEIARVIQSAANAIDKQERGETQQRSDRKMEQLVNQELEQRAARDHQQSAEKELEHRVSQIRPAPASPPTLYRYITQPPITRDSPAANSAHYLRALKLHRARVKHRAAIIKRARQSPDLKPKQSQVIQQQNQRIASARRLYEVHGEAQRYDALYRLDTRESKDAAISRRPQKISLATPAAPAAEPARFKSRGRIRPGRVFRRAEPSSDLSSPLPADGVQNLTAVEALFAGEGYEEHKRAAMSGKWSWAGDADADEVAAEQGVVEAEKGDDEGSETRGSQW